MDELYMEQPLDFSKIKIDTNLSYQEFNFLDGDIEINIQINHWTQNCMCGLEEEVLVDVFDRFTGECGKMCSTKDFFENYIEEWQDDILKLKNEVILRGIEFDRGIF